MNKITLFFVFLFSFICLAEYQIYDYKASVKKIEPVFSLSNGTLVETEKIVNDSLYGYLVIPCCYPCGAPFGHSYPGYLYIVRKNDKLKRVWKLPVSAEFPTVGSVFGRKADYLSVWDIYWKNQPAYLKGKLTQSSLYFRVTSSANFMEDMKVKKNSFSWRYGLFGFNYSIGYLDHSGFGTAKYTYIPKEKNEEYDYKYDTIKPYIASVSGSIIGQFEYFGVQDETSLFEPCDYLTSNKVTPISGTFVLKYNKKHSTKTYMIEWEKIEKYVLDLLYQRSYIESGKSDFEEE